MFANKFLASSVYFAALLGFAYGRIRETQGQRSLQSDEEMINVIVKYKDTFNLSRTRAGSGSQGGVLHKQFKRINAAALSIRAGEIAALQNDPNVEYVEEDHMMFRSSEAVGFGVSAVQADSDLVPLLPADTSAGCFKICVIDSGLLISHPDIPYSVEQGNVIGDQFGLRSGEFWFNPLDDHGSHVTGTIIAQGGNGEGIRGVVPSSDGICLLIARAFGDAEGGALGSSINDALEWCGDNGARVINMSLGSGFFSTSQRRIIQALDNEGVLIVAASGNDGDDALNYPASYPESMSVGAIDEDMEWARFSQFNSEVDVCAPGVAINSTVPSIAIFDEEENKYDALLMEGGRVPSDMLTREVADCGLALETCETVSGKICVIERGTETFLNKAINCEDGGGVGAIIYNSQGNSGIVRGTLGEGSVGIPVISLSRQDGLDLSSTVSVTIDVRAAGYRLASGTSMAAPHATGVVARIWSVRPECTNVQVREAVEKTALDLGEAGRDDKYGAGLVQMEAAYLYLLGLDAPCGTGGVIEPAPSPPTVAPTRNPTKAPTKSPTKAPTKAPSKAPTKIPTRVPTKSPTKEPTDRPNPAPFAFAFTPPSQPQQTQAGRPVFEFLGISPTTTTNIFTFPGTPSGTSPPASFSFSAPSAADIFFQNEAASDAASDGSEDLPAAEAASDGSENLSEAEGDIITSLAAEVDESSAYSCLPSVNLLATSTLMAILLTFV